MIINNVDLDHLELHESIGVSSVSSMSIRMDEAMSNRYIVMDLREVTNLMEEQQKFYDRMYLEAIETNYSHE